jgi:tetratricopeptide (TPR) repeat protein
MADYEAVLRLHPAHAQATFWLGAVRLQTGATEQAVRLLTRAIDLGCPDLGSAYLFLGMAYQRLGQTERAVETLRKSQQTGDSRATMELQRMGAQ